MQRQLQRRHQRDLARRRRNLIVSIIGTLVVIGVVIGFIISTNNDKAPPAAKGKSGSSTTAAPSSSTPPSSSSAAKKVPAYPCTWSKSSTPAARKVSVPPLTKPPRKGTVDVTLGTSRGTVVFALDRAEAPCAVESFLSLTKQKYFDSTPCHRLVTTGIYVLQCGDPTGKGSGGPGYSFADEVSGKVRYTRGALAMANGGPNTNGSQFFIVYKDSLTLPPNYTVFGRVSKGMPVIDNVAAKGAVTAGDGKPKLSISITKATAG